MPQSACGVLEVTHTEHVPGTALFSEDPNTQALAAYEGVDLSLLKRAPGKHSEIILVPQPSSVNPNDPLLWPTWKKHLFFLILVYGTVLVGAVGPLVAADQTNIAGEFNASLTDFARVLSGYFVLTLGVATIGLQVGSVKFGKRPIYLSTSILLLISTVWASYSTNLGSFTGARIIMGIAAAPLEFLVGASINDVYYVHERGLPVAIWNLALINGINITPVIAGQILNKPNLGFRWAFRFFAIATGVLVLLQFFFMPESTFIRESIVARPSPPVEKVVDDRSDKADALEHVDHPHILERGGAVQVPKRSMVSELNPFSGIYHTKSSSLMLLARPLLLLFTPIVFWGGLLYGMAITYLVTLAVSISVIFSFPPYDFDSASVGLTYLGPFIGASIATFIAGPLSTLSARLLSKKNGGVYEPEFRLPIVVFYLIFGVFGFVGYGWSLQVADPWIGPVFFFGICNFAIVLGSTAAVGYVIDAHRHTADAALGALIFWKNIWSFGLTWNLVAQILQYGTRDVFAIISALIAFSCLCTIPMYILGKRTRSFVHRILPFSEEDEVSVVSH